MTVEDRHLVVRVGEGARRYGYAEVGFANRKTGAPDHGWVVLTALARGAGRIDPPDGIRTKSARLKRAVSVLRARLRALVPLDGDPFHVARPGTPYRSRFRVRWGDRVVVPVPPGAAWIDVTFTSVGAGAFTITVGGDDRPIRCHVRDLGLSAEGRSALDELVRGRGTVRRPASDAGMLALSAALSRVVPLEGPPLTVAGNVWTARFDVTTLRPASDR